MQHFSNSFEVIKIINDLGYNALVVGGAVRDHVMGRVVHDIDLATDMPLETVSSTFAARDIGKSSRFGLLSIKHNGQRFEISSFRGQDTNCNSKAGHDRNIKDIFLVDARHRDFTVNALAMDTSGRILDPLDGRSDMNSRIIRTPSHPRKIMSDDPLRMLRAIRFASDFDYGIEHETFECLRLLRREISRAAPERIRDELLRMSSLEGNKFARGLILMDESGLLEMILPEISRMKNFEHDRVHHPEGGVFEHTIAAVKANNKALPELNLSILFHDVGKTETYSLNKGRPAYHCHDRAGEAIIRKAGQRLMLPCKLINTMSFAAANHMKGMRIIEMKPSKAFKLLSDPDWPILESVIRCDLMTRNPDSADIFQQDVREVSQKLDQWMKTMNSKRPGLITGTQVMEYTGLPQGPEIGRILKQAADWAIDNNITDRNRIRDYVRRLAG